MYKNFHSKYSYYGISSKTYIITCNSSLLYLC
nr:CPPV297 hypothetical protein [Cooks petrelpox virus]